MNYNSNIDESNNAYNYLGMVTYQILKHKFLNENNPEGNLVLSRLDKEIIVSLVQAAENDRSRPSSLKFCLNRTQLQGYHIDEQHLTNANAVAIRNMNTDGSFFISAEFSQETQSSGSTVSLGSQDIEEPENAIHWVKAFKEFNSENNLYNEKDANTLIESLLSLKLWTLETVAKYVLTVLKYTESKELSTTAGENLFILGMPRNDSLFSSGKKTFSVWRKKLESHWKNRCYLKKTDDKTSQPFDPVMLKNILAESEKEGDISVDLRKDFIDYANSAPGQITEESRKLFSLHDWPNIEAIFKYKKSASKKKLGIATRELFRHEGAEQDLSEGDIDLLESLDTKPRVISKDEIIDFFQNHQNVLEQDRSVYQQWEKKVFDTTIECDDFLDGLLQCLEKSAVSKEYRDKRLKIRIEGKGTSMKKPNSFRSKNRKACEFFEHQYGNIEQFFSELIVVTYTTCLIFKYRDKVVNSFDNDNELKSNQTGKDANSFEFDIIVFYEEDGHNEDISKNKLVWRYKPGSVYNAYLDDLTRLVAYSGLIECKTNRDAIGTKGVPFPICLTDTRGFQGSAGGVKGSFVKAKDKSKNYLLTPKWEQSLEEEFKNGNLADEERNELYDLWNNFGKKYKAILESLLKRELGFCSDLDMNDLVQEYSTLLEKIAFLRETPRRRLLKHVLKIGIVEIPAELGEGTATIICPWHPLRLQSLQAKQNQIKNSIRNILSEKGFSFCDEIGKLYFDDMEEFISTPLLPDIAVFWGGNSQLEPQYQVVSQGYGAYTLHESPIIDITKKQDIHHDDPQISVAIVQKYLTEFLRLQPHEQDNLSLVLYNCDSRTLPVLIAEIVNKLNEERMTPSGKRQGLNEITCQIMMTHQNPNHLREVYKVLLSRTTDTDDVLGTEVTGEFLSRVRINICSSRSIQVTGMSKPIDIVFCQDVVSRLASIEWYRSPKNIFEADNLKPHLWGRKTPISRSDDTSRIFLTCPVQTKESWSYLLAISSLFTSDDIKALWERGQCHLPARKIDFASNELSSIFSEVHRIGKWVVNYDDLLDRRLLEQQNVAVIKHEQDSILGKNTIVSSTATNKFLNVALKLKIAQILNRNETDQMVTVISDAMLKDANLLSGGLVLRAARRLKNTNELIGCVLSKFLLEEQIREHKYGTAWCFLDDYAKWLGKSETSGIADILAITPYYDEGSKEYYLDVIVTESKFVDANGISEASNKSGRQLLDTVKQLFRSIDLSVNRLDQELILARISELLVNNLIAANFASEEWKMKCRTDCHIRVRGYSHVFCYGPKDFQQAYEFSCVENNGDSAITECYQEVFGPDLISKLLQLYYERRTNNIDVRDLVKNIRLRKAGEHEVEGLNVESESFVHINLTKSAIADNTEGEVFKEEEILQEPLIPNTTNTEISNVKLDSVPSTFQENNSILKYLDNRINTQKDQLAGVREWKDVTEEKTRRAFRDRSLPFELASSPILSPNSLIFKIKGSSRITEKIINDKKAEMMTTSGVDILSVVGESGQISVAVKRKPRAILITEEMFKYFLIELSSNKKIQYDIPLAIQEDNNSIVYLRPFSAPHTLVAGTTGSGKSVLLRNMIAAICLALRKNDAEIVLIDAKGGLDFQCLYDLPHIQEYQGNKLIDDPGLAIEILQQTNIEMDRRYELFKQSKVDNLVNYRLNTEQPMPVTWVFFDEFGIWMQDNAFKRQMEPIINKLAKKSRAAGIFLVLADQRPDNTDFPMQTRSNLSNRLVLKVADKGTSKIALGNEGAENLLPHGHMLALTPALNSPVFCQVPYITPENMAILVAEIIRAENVSEDDIS